MKNRFLSLVAMALIIRAAPALASGGIVNGIVADLIVAADKSGDFTSVQQAINSIPTDNKRPKVIFVTPGKYYEKLTIKPAFVHLIGEDSKKTILTYDDYAKKAGPNGPIGTFGSLSVSVTGNDFEADNITFENTAAPRHEVGQAVALGVQSDRAVFRNCRMLANQDTLYAQSGRQYYYQCEICGDVDYIFGNATAVFDNCHINSTGRGYITAQSRTDGSQTAGYVLTDCKVTAASSVAGGSVFLGRPWRPYARVVYLHCDLGPQIDPVGWRKWRPNDTTDTTAFYAQYACTGPGANTSQRVAWSHQLTQAEAQKFSKENFLKGDDGWAPWKGNSQVSAASQPTSRPD